MFTKQDLKSSTLAELQKELKQAKLKLQELRIGVKTSHLKDTSAIQKQKCYIARILTTIKEIEFEELVKKATVLESAQAAA